MPQALFVTRPYDVACIEFKKFKRHDKYFLELSAVTDIKFNDFVIWYSDDDGETYHLRQSLPSKVLPLGDKFLHQAKPEIKMEWGKAAFRVGFGTGNMGLCSAILIGSSAIE